MKIIQPEFTQDDKGLAWFRLRNCDESIVDRIIDPKILGIRWKDGVLVHTGEGIFKNIRVTTKRVDTPRYTATGYHGKYCEKTYGVSWGVDPKYFTLTVQRANSNEKNISSELVREIMELLAEYVLNED
jgi:hypothetical protein|tara:strand:- start:147 stop:533 length:387 start_codon:yes stop_codon:yes gene_type:complete